MLSNLDQLERLLSFAASRLRDLEDKEAEAVGRYIFSQTMRKASFKRKQVEEFVEAFRQLEAAKQSAEGVSPLKAIIENTRGDWYSQIVSDRKLGLDTAETAYESAIRLATPEAEKEGQSWWRMLYGKREDVMEMMRDHAWLQLGGVRENQAKLARTKSSKIERLRASADAYRQASQGKSEFQQAAAQEGLRRVENELATLEGK